jgi:ACT domain-containing protein
MKAIVTVIGSDKVGIIAAVSAKLAEHNVNILDINQTVMREYFTMMMLVELEALNVPFTQLSEELSEVGRQIGLSIRVQREDIFKSMHEV